MSTLLTSLADARARAPGHLVSTREGTLHALVRGAGPDVVLVHGITDSLHTWHRVQEALAGEHRVHALDLPGHGLSDIPATPLTIRAMGAALVAYLDAAGIKDAVLVGNSLGCGVSLAAAHLAPSRVRALVLLCSVGAPFTLPPGLALLKAEGIARWMPRLGRSQGLRRFLMRDAIAPGFTLEDAYVRRYWEGWRVEGRAAYVSALLSSLDSLEVAPWLPYLTMPVNVVHGLEDRTIPSRVGREVAALIPGATLTMLSGVGHMPQLERPEETTRMVRAAAVERRATGIAAATAS